MQFASLRFASLAHHLPVGCRRFLKEEIAAIVIYDKDPKGSNIDT